MVRQKSERENEAEHLQDFACHACERNASLAGNFANQISEAAIRHRINAWQQTRKANEKDACRLLLTGALKSCTETRYPSLSTVIEPVHAKNARGHLTVYSILPEHSQSRKPERQPACRLRIR